MSGFIAGAQRNQVTLFPETLEDYVAEHSAARVIDVFVDELDLRGLGFATEAPATGRPGHHPATLLKLHVYGYMNRIQSSRRLEREAQRNVELMWLTGYLTPDFKTIAEMSLHVLAYNLIRVIGILGARPLIMAMARA